MMAAFPFNRIITLQTPRVLLRPLEREDFRNLIPLVKENPDLLKFSPSPWGTEKDLQHYINTALEEKMAKKRYPLVVFDKQANAYAGSTSFMSISHKNSRLEIGHTWIGKAFQRSGLNRNMKFLMMRYVFEELGYKRLEFKTDARNLQSRTAIEGVGGKYEGLLRSHTLMPDGFRRDTVYYSVLAHEWPEIKSTVFKDFN